MKLPCSLINNVFMYIFYYNITYISLTSFIYSFNKCSEIAPEYIVKKLHILLEPYLFTTLLLHCSQSQRAGCLSTDEQIQEICCTYTVEFYTSIKKNKITKCVGKCMILEKNNKLGNQSIEGQIAHALSHTSTQLLITNVYLYFGGSESRSQKT